MKPQLDEINAVFIKEYESALARAVSLFQERKAEGRNAHMPPVGMFCFGAQSAVTLIWMKTCRLVGNSETGNVQKQIEECEDIINYAAMCIAYLRVTEGPAGNTSSLEGFVEAVEKFSKSGLKTRTEK